MTEDYRARAVLLDIEGTTGSIAFVHETLFPYARQRMTAYVAAHSAQSAAILAKVASTTDEAVTRLLAWMDEDRKETPLKALQGMIWREGYEGGALRGHVYDDAVRAMRAWKAQGIDLYIYSSGSVEAQRLLFAHSVAGDLSPLLSGYFDTETGPKGEPGSYGRIADQVGAAPGDILFLSDAPAEISAASQAGMQAVLVSRAGGPGIATFDDIALEATAA